MSSKLLLLLLAITFSDCADYGDSPRNFSMELIHFTARQTDNHIVISPFGVWTLMTGIALGATGKSFDQLRRAFILSGNERTFVRGYKNLTDIVLTPKSPAVSLSSKNFVFIDKDFVMNDEFRLVLQKDFKASIKTLDFADANSAAKTANGYILNTGAVVSNVLKSDDFVESRLILTNVISFKGLWGSPFKTEDTTLESFYDENRNEIGKVNLMYQRGEFPYSNVKQLNSFVVELPYGSDGKYSMLVILPYQRVKVTDVYKNFEKVTLKDVIDKLEKDTDEFGLGNTDVRIPRFKISTNIVLNRPLYDMGVRDIFDSRVASFGRITKEPIFVSAIVHKADIEVTESGTVASASSVAGFADRISPPSFVANRPFIYFVIEKTTTTVIFGGIYSKPTVF